MIFNVWHSHKLQDSQIARLTRFAVYWIFPFSWASWVSRDSQWYFHEKWDSFSTKFSREKLGNETHFQPYRTFAPLDFHARTFAVLDFRAIISCSCSISIYSQDRTAKTGWPEQDRQNRTGRTGLAELDRQNRTGRMGQVKEDRQNRIGITGQAEQDR